MARTATGQWLGANGGLHSLQGKAELGRKPSGGSLVRAPLIPQAEQGFDRSRRPTLGLIRDLVEAPLRDRWGGLIGGADPCRFIKFGIGARAAAARHFLHQRQDLPELSDLTRGVGETGRIGVSRLMRHGAGDYPPGAKEGLTRSSSGCGGGPAGAGTFA